MPPSSQLVATLTPAPALALPMRPQCQLLKLQRSPQRGATVSPLLSSEPPHKSVLLCFAAFCCEDAPTSFQPRLPHTMEDPSKKLTCTSALMQESVYCATLGLTVLSLLVCSGVALLFHS